MKANKKSESIEIDTNDYVSAMMGKYNDGLVSLRIQTFKGTIKEFGNVKDEGEEYELDIKGDDRVSPVFGTFTQAGNATVLSSIGFHLSKDG
mmetsp:Transcript_82837/g.115063  ORF Transcript_82837/g.115063 Transcript_82837/m.115063 type:complete len:92 (+) Transcript_82837:971-1246(+)